MTIFHMFVIYDDDGMLSTYASCIFFHVVFAEIRTY